MFCMRSNGLLPGRSTCPLGYGTTRSSSLPKRSESIHPNPAFESTACIAFQFGNTDSFATVSASRSPRHPTLRTQRGRHSKTVQRGRGHDTGQCHPRCRTRAISRLQCWQVVLGETAPQVFASHRGHPTLDVRDKVREGRSRIFSALLETMNYFTSNRI